MKILLVAFGLIIGAFIGYEAHRVPAAPAPITFTIPVTITPQPAAGRHTNVIVSTNGGKTTFVTR